MLHKVDRASLIIAVVGMAFVFIVALGRVLPDGVREWGMFSFALVAAIATIAIGFARDR